MKKRTEQLMISMAAAAVIILSLGGCGQRVGPDQTEKQTEKQTTAPIVITEKQTEKPTEKQTETKAPETEKESETQKLITSVDYTSKDGSVKITLPDNTWKVTQDADEMRVFKSDDDAIINIVHANTETSMRGLTVMTSEDDLKASLTKQYTTEDAYEIESFNEGTFDDIKTYRYVVRYNAAARMWAYAVTYAIMAPDQAYVVTGTVTDDNKPLLASVQKSVESFRVLGDEDLKTVTSEIISGKTQKTSETVAENTASAQELKSLTDYGTTVKLVTSDNVNVRMAPGTDSDILTSLNNKTEVNVVGETDNWFKVDIQGNTGYIRKDFLVYGTPATTAQSDTTSATTSQATNSELATASNYGSSATLYASSDVNVRSAPGTDSSVINGLSTGSSVSVIGETDNWYIVSIGGSTGYISKSYLSVDQPSTSSSSNSETSNGGENSGSGSGSSSSIPSAVSGTITGATADTLTIAGDNGVTYTVYYGGAGSVYSEDGLYEGVYVEVNVDTSQSSSDWLYASGVQGY